MKALTSLRSVHWVIAASLFLPISAHSSLAGYIDACGRHITPSEVNFNSSELSQLAIFTLMSTSASDDATLRSKFAALTAGGLFDGTLEGARKRKTELERRLNVTYTRDQAIGYVSRFMSNIGATAFGECVRAAFNAPGLHVAVQHLDGTGASIRARYKAQEGETRALTFGIETNGETPWTQRLSIAPGGGSRDFVVSRRNPARDLHVVVEARHESVVLVSESIFIPPDIRVEGSVEPLQDIKSDTSAANCGMFRDGKTHYGAVVEVVADAGARITDVQRVVTELRGGRLGLQPGEGTGMELVESTSRMVKARAICKPGVNTDDSYHVKGHVVAKQVRDKVQTVRPEDNGVQPVSQRVRSCRWWHFFQPSCAS